MTKAELVDRLTKAASGPSTGRNVPKADVEAILRALGVTAQQALAHGDTVPLPGIGCLLAKQRAPRRGRNPRTGVPMLIPGCTVPMFRASKDLKAALKWAQA